MAQQTTFYNTRGSCPVLPLIVAGCMLRVVCCTLCVVCDPALSRRRATTSGSCTAGLATPTRPSSTSRVIWPSPRARSAPTTRRQPAAACRTTASPPPHGRPQRSSEACVAPPDCCGRANAAQAARPSGYQGNLWYWVLRGYSWHSRHSQIRYASVRYPRARSCCEQVRDTSEMIAMVRERCGPVPHSVLESRLPGRDTIPGGIPFREGYHSGRDTIPGGIPCRAGPTAV